MRLLPRNHEAGWTPYAWLIYLLMFIAYPLFARQPLWMCFLTWAAVCVFLPLYFWGYWLDGKKVLMPIAGILALGIAFAPVNTGASVLFVFAAGFIGEIAEPGVSVRYLLGLVALVGAISWLWHLHPTFWIPALVLTALIGGVDIQQAQRRRMNRKLRMAQEEIEQLAKLAERERIARDLHDLLGHTLSVIILKSELASKLADKDLNRAIAEIRDVERISRDALAEVRQAVKGYRSSGLDSEFQRAIETLRTAGVGVETSSEPVSLSATQESVLVLALREAVTNVVRHSRATSCEIHFRRTSSGCELRIEDNGSGGNAPEGSGLSGMRQRVETLGGTVDRKAGEGTRLVITLPIQNVRSMGAA